jgi:hypothetical protein
MPSVVAKKKKKKKKKIGFFNFFTYQAISLSCNLLRMPIWVRSDWRSAFYAALCIPTQNERNGMYF